MKIITTVGDSIPGNIYMVVRNRKHYELIGKAQSYPHDNPIWTDSMKQSSEWWIIVAPTSNVAFELARAWPRRTSLPSGARILNHGVNK